MSFCCFQGNPTQLKVEMEGTDSNLLISLIILMFQNLVFKLVSDFDQ